MRRLLFLVLFFYNFTQAQTNCRTQEAELIIEIRTDNYGYETAWEVKDKNGDLYGWANYNTLGNRRLYRDTLCLPAGRCANFRIYDSFGDGISAIGYYKLWLNGRLMASGGNFSRSETVFLQCAAGEICQTAIRVTGGRYIAPLDDTWYTLTPDTTGIYRISTCEGNTCDTKIWVYDRCEGITVAEDNQSTIFYNDDENPCAPRAVVVGYFHKGKTYYIRIGDKDDACADSIRWELKFEGQVKGCMNPQSCNYNPLATINDGSCLPQGHPRCPKGPDLRIRQDSLIRSIRLDTIWVNDHCLVQEGCLRGYGVRNIMRFTTLIENIGEKDYYIGRPSPTNRLFSYNNCHNHYHYDSYAEYVLYREDGIALPIGFKFGFCVSDFGCPPGVVPKYSCDNMGITAGCYDNYWSNLQCQWIDLTDVPDGRYVFVARINWKNLPDALGQVEKDLDNNWAQACIRLDRSSGKLRLTVESECRPYRDCLGIPYGTAQPDCAGVCAGNAIIGDVDRNGLQNLSDAHRYVTMLLGNDLDLGVCSDLTGDGEITIYDAALLANCINNRATHVHLGLENHNHCRFPWGITNIHDTVGLRILDVNWAAQYVDIGIRNPVSKINAYQLEMDGLFMAYVENLVDERIYPIAPRTGMTNGVVLGISYQDSLIPKSEMYQPLCRIHFFKTFSDTICIRKIVDVVNSKYERVITRIEGTCAVWQALSDTREAMPELRLIAVPNPFTEETVLSFANPSFQKFELEITDFNGRRVQYWPEIRGNEVRIQRQGLIPGVYFFRLWNEKSAAHGRLLLQ